MRFAELEEFVDLKLKNYSSGMYVRLGFAAAIQADADVYLVDEVLAVGDARFQEKCFDTFRRLKREGRTVVYVTHDLATVERFCDRALLLERGEVAAIGEPARRDAHLLPAQPRGGAGRATERMSDLRDGGGATAPPRSSRRGSRTRRGNRQETLAQGEPATFRARIRFHGPLEEPVFGVILKNERGQTTSSSRTRRSTDCERAHSSRATRPCIR